MWGAFWDERKIYAIQEPATEKLSIDFPTEFKWQSEDEESQKDLDA